MGNIILNGEILETFLQIKKITRISPHLLLCIYWGHKQVNLGRKINKSCRDGNGKKIAILICK